MWKVRELGLTARWRGRARFGERLITLTAPHVGSARDRVRWMRDAFAWFNRKLHEYRLDELGAANVRYCAQARFFEWTDGDDGQGHPHWHVWDFGPFVPRELLTEWWHEAWRRTSRSDAPMLDVDVRAVAGDTVENGETRIDKELVKYLTKSWGGSADAFAEVYAELVGRRARQTSRGFASWSVELVDVCPRCGLVLDQTEVLWRREPVEGSATSELHRYQPRTSVGPPPVAGAIHHDVRGHLEEEWGERDHEYLEQTRGLRALLRERLRVLRCITEVSRDTTTVTADKANRRSTETSEGR